MKKNNNGTPSSTVERRREAKGMSERAPLSKDMLNTLRTMALHSMPEGHGGWKLFGYIDWLEEKLGNVEGLNDWREAFGHPDA